jgi:hypothetical protein
MHHPMRMKESRILPDLDAASRSSEILSELQTVLDSDAFRSSLRAREFLSYVVHEALEGDREGLKERSIGVNLYHRPATYITGDDPVVRVKAAEVRRRLSKHYAENQTSILQIELPVGSYVPLFRVPHASAPAPDSSSEITHEPGTPLQTERRGTRTTRISKAWLASIPMAVVAVAAVALVFFRPVSTARTFWGPLLSSHHVVLICVASPVSYALSSETIKRVGAPPQAIGNSELGMNTTPVKLAPDTTVKGSEITPMVDYFVNKDDAYVISGLSRIFTQLGQDDELRIGKDLTFADLRSSPAVLVGAFNNPWTLKMGADLPYAFNDNAGLPLIQEKANPAHAFRPEAQGRLGTHDFAIIARLLTSKTGQPLVIIAGTGMSGTEAAGRILYDDATLKTLLARAPKDWSRKNLEFVLETDLVDGSSSQPHVVASKSW